MPPAERGEEQVVFACLAADFAEQSAGVSGFFGVGPRALMFGVQIVQRDTPFESNCQQQMSQRLQQIAGFPLLVTGYPQNAVPGVVVDADDVGNT